MADMITVCISHILLLSDLSFVLGEVMNSHCEYVFFFRSNPYYRIVWNTVIILLSLVSNVGDSIFGSLIFFQC